MRNKLLAKKVLCSVLAASVFGMAGSALAADSAYPKEDANINADTEYTTNGTITAGITGTGNENVTIINMMIQRLKLPLKLLKTLAILK